MERTERIEEEVRKVVGKLIDQELKDPRLTGLISITKVYVTRDLKICKIYVSMLGTQDKDAAMAALKSASGIARKAIGNNIRMHYTPEVSFEFDDSLEYGDHIQNLINELDIKHDEEVKDINEEYDGEDKEIIEEDDVEDSEENEE